jgi:hypothetical protein
MMVDRSRIFSAFEMGMINFDFEEIYEPAYGEPGHDYGEAEDGWPNPEPCIVCGVPLGACVPIINPLTGSIINE